MFTQKGIGKRNGIRRHEVFQCCYLRRVNCTILHIIKSKNRPRPIYIIHGSIIINIGKRHGHLQVTHGFVEFPRVLISTRLVRVFCPLMLRTLCYKIYP